MKKTIYLLWVDGGSDTTALAISAAMHAKKCYIFSDVDGVYVADPNKVKNAQKLKEVSCEQMKEISNEGAKVLHNRCIEIAEKFDIPIIAKSTFNSNDGTIILNNKKETRLNSKQIEENIVNGIIKKDISKISIVGNGLIRDRKIINNVLDVIYSSKLEMLSMEVSDYKICIYFKETLDDNILKKLYDVTILDWHKHFTMI